MLRLTDVHTYYDEHYVLQGLSLHVPEASVIALLGRNGAGKMTCLNLIIGFVPPRSGEIAFRGQAIQGKPPHRIAAKGIALDPQGKRLFPSLTVRENLTIAARPGGWTLDRAYALFPILEKREKLTPVLLSGGEQQMLAIGRALMTNPSLILMDEPTEGLAPIIIRDLGKAIRQLSEEGLTMLLVEQNLELALSVAHRRRCRDALVGDR